MKEYAPIDIIGSINPGDMIPVMVEVVKIDSGNIWFKSDDGTLAYRRYQDVRDAITYKACTHRNIKAGKIKKIIEEYETGVVSLAESFCADCGKILV